MRRRAHARNPGVLHAKEQHRALALFSFPSFAAYEQYRTLFGKHPDFIAADRIREESGCVVRYDRSFMRPMLPGSNDAAA